MLGKVVNGHCKHSGTMMGIFRVMWFLYRVLFEMANPREEKPCQRYSECKHWEVWSMYWVQRMK